MKFYQSNRLLALFLPVLLFACSQENQPLSQLHRQADDSFTEYISAYSTGKLSSRSPITVQLADTVSTHKRNAVAPTRLFSFEPAIRGKATWITGRLIEFVPNQALESGQEYRAKLNLAPLLEVEQGKETFSFGFRVIKQNYDVEIEGLVYAEGSLQIKGQFITADFSDTLQVAKAINFEVRHRPDSRLGVRPEWRTQASVCSFRGGKKERRFGGKLQSRWPGHRRIVEFSGISGSTSAQRFQSAEHQGGQAGSTLRVGEVQRAAQRRPKPQWPHHHWQTTKPPFRCGW